MQGLIGAAFDHLAHVLEDDIAARALRQTVGDLLGDDLVVIGRRRRYRQLDGLYRNGVVETKALTVFGVFALIAKVVGTTGFDAFRALGLYMITRLNEAGELGDADLEEVGVLRNRELDVHRTFGGQPMRRAVVGRLEGGAVVIDLRLEREHLVATRVGEHEAMPVGEAVDPPERGHGVGPGPQHQVVGVAQHDLCTQPLVVGCAEVLDRRPGADGHEQRCRVRPPRRRRRASRCRRWRTCAIPGRSRFRGSGAAYWYRRRSKAIR